MFFEESGQMKVLLVSSEAVPYAKTGGLADVVGVLLEKLLERGVEARLIMPLYAGVKDRFELSDTGLTITVPVGGRVFESRVLSHGPGAFFLECDELYDRDGLYGTKDGDFADNDYRFVMLSRGALDACLALGFSPDVVHANDWQTGLIPLYMKTLYSDSFSDARSLFTIHNLGYQGIFPPRTMGLTGLDSRWFAPSGLEFFGNVNFLKAGIVAADMLNTVSDNYAREILTPRYGHGLEGVLRKRVKDLSGILNGIDYNQWDPSRDPALPARYSGKSIAGKKACKAELVSKCLFSRPDAPVLGIVGRLSSQKGLDVFIESAPAILSLGVSIVVLGDGEEALQMGLDALASANSGAFFFRSGYDESFARLIYSGADMVLMPSRYEPCGLVQMIAMRYGTVPVARKTGGISDTVLDYDHLACEGTGFLFDELTPSMIECSFKRALCVFSDGKKWKKVVSMAMSRDFSWSASAGKYIGLYEKLAHGGDHES